MPAAWRPHPRRGERSVRHECRREVATVSHRRLLDRRARLDLSRMTGSMRGALAVSCHDCGRLIVTAPRIRDAELDRLRGHLRQLHPYEGLREGAVAADVLRSFDVKREP